MDEIQPIVLTRHRIEKWLYAPYFEDVAAGSYVRLFIGQDDQKKSVYRLCQVLGMVSEIIRKKKRLRNYYYDKDNLMRDT